MLLWFCDEAVVNRVAGGGQLAEEDYVEVHVLPDNVPDEVVDHDISLLECYFTTDGWILVPQTGS